MKIILVAVLGLGLTLVGTSASASDDPCAMEKSMTPIGGYHNLVNCYIQQAIRAYGDEQVGIINENPHTKEEADAKWHAIDAIDKAITELEVKKIPKGSFVDIRKEPVP